jgi:hypothetical protein
MLLDLELHDSFYAQCHASIKACVSCDKGRKQRRSYKEFVTSFPSPTSDCQQTEDWVKAQRKDNAVLWTTDEIAPEIIPDLSGMTLRDAIFLLENHGVMSPIKVEGRIITSQSIPPGKENSKRQSDLTEAWMILLKDILYKVSLQSTSGDMNIPISGVQFDSRKVEKGDLFVAVKGTQVDGHNYIKKRHRSRELWQSYANKHKHLLMVPQLSELLIAPGH